MKFITGRFVVTSEDLENLKSYQHRREGVGLIEKYITQVREQPFFSFQFLNFTLGENNTSGMVL